MPQDRWRQAARDGLGVVAATIVLCGALEGAARLSGHDPRPTSLPPKATGSFRIVALGGSTVLGVPAGAFGFVAQLGASLRRLAPDRTVDVVNLARAGEGSHFVRAELERALDASPDLFVVLTGHNEFLAEPPPRGARGALQRVRDASALVAMLEAGARRLTARGDADVALPERVEPVDRAGLRFERTAAAFRENLAAIVASARARRVPLILCTAPSNLADWPPVHDAIGWAHADPEYEAVVARLEGDLSAGRHAAVLAEVAPWRTLHGDDAMLDWVEATSLRALGRDDEARALFLRARETDPLPLRALDLFNEAVRAYAGTPGVRVVDAERLFERHAAGSFVGFELVADNCHPTPLGNAIIAREIARVMAEEGWLVPVHTALGTAAEWEASAWRRLGGAEAQNTARALWLLSNAIYAMKTPFLNASAARDYLDRAAVLAPGDWRIWANLGTLSLLAGDAQRGRRELAHATRLKGAPLDPRDRGSTPYLQEALERGGLAPESFSRASGGGS